MNLAITDNETIIILISFFARIITGIGFALGNLIIFASIPIFYKETAVYKFGLLESAASIG